MTQTSRTFDLVFRVDLLIDGTGAPGGSADVGVQEDAIAVIAPRGSLNGRRTVKAPALCPGFIDIHSHGDVEPFIYPRAESKVMQGVTTEVSGNCGSSAFPLQGAYLGRMQEKAASRGVNITWIDAAGYFAALERRGMGINRAFLVGHNTLRAAVMGYEDRAPSESELREMRHLLAEALQQGAAGLSTGLLYPPGCYAADDEVAALAREAALLSRLYTTHMRSEGNDLIAAVEEACRIGRGARIRIQISHLKTSGKSNWGKVAELEQTLKHEMAAGADIACDRYPYTAGSTDLDAVLPSWAYEGGVQAELARLQDPVQREKLLDLLRAKDSAYWDSVLIARVETAPSKEMEGLTVRQAADRLRLPPPEAVIELLIRERTRIEALFFGMCEENMRRILSWPFVMVGSDSTALDFAGRSTEGKPHPRGFGSFAKVLAVLVREEKLLTIEEAVRKMTSFPASRLGLPRRGVIREGFFADLVAFDPERIRDNAVYGDPWRRPEGISMVVINGAVVIENGDHTGALPGRVLRT